MAVNDGSDIWVKAGTAVVNGLTTKNLDLAADEIDVTTQDSTGGYKEFLTGEKSGTISFEFLDDESDTHAYDELFDLWVAGAAIAFIYGKGIKTTGKRTISGNAIITALSKNDGKNGPASCSCTLRITGSITKATSTTTVA